MPLSQRPRPSYLRSHTVDFWCFSALQRTRFKTTRKFRYEARKSTTTGYPPFLERQTAICSLLNFQASLKEHTHAHTFAAPATRFRLSGQRQTTPGRHNLIQGRDTQPNKQTAAAKGTNVETIQCLPRQFAQRSARAPMGTRSHARVSAAASQRCTRVHCGASPKTVRAVARRHTGPPRSRRRGDRGRESHATPSTGPPSSIPPSSAATRKPLHAVRGPLAVIAAFSRIKRMNIVPSVFYCVCVFFSPLLLFLFCIPFCFVSPKCSFISAYFLFFPVHIATPLFTGAQRCAGRGELHVQVFCAWSRRKRRMTLSS